VPNLLEQEDFERLVNSAVLDDDLAAKVNEFDDF
jgi:hypothetical protein